MTLLTASPGTALPSGLAEVLAAGSLRSVYQPIVDLATGEPVGYEALVRGPAGPWERPDVLFTVARQEGLLAELDHACRSVALHGAVARGLLAPLTLFVNVEPEVLDQAPLADLLAIADHAPGELRVVLEITERALAARPAQLLRTVERVRDLGWGVALDDVGAESLSLAFMPLLRPDVVKLDLRLVQDRPGPAIAEIMNAVNAYAERSGALVLAEGIETESHLAVARALGASLGQGWLFGRPQPDPQPSSPTRPIVLPAPAPRLSARLSPFDCLPATTATRIGDKRLLVEVSKQLEREAMRIGETCVLASTFQEAKHVTPATVQRYRDVVDRVGFACALGEGLTAEPLPGLRGAHLEADDPVRGEWDVVVLGPHFAAALLARDLGDTGPDADRRFEFALTYDREAVTRAAHVLLSRVAPSVPGQRLPDRRVSPPQARVPERRQAEPLLERALAATRSGVTIADMLQPDQPLIYANAAFARLAGHELSDMLGRNCRFLQGPDTDPAAIRRIRAAIAEGREVRETILNLRGPQREPWWNEVWLAPVHDDAGRLVQYIGVQDDVTARVEAERALVLERARTRSYLDRIEQLAHSDLLTGLPNRRGMERTLEQALARAEPLALLFLDLDGFKGVNDAYGHAVGDQLLAQVADRLAGCLSEHDLLARLGGDEFLVLLPGADRAPSVSAAMAEAVARPFPLPERPVRVGVSIGAAHFPSDGRTFGELLHVADLRMYADKQR